MSDNCDWFDAKWYLQEYLDVISLGMYPSFHYLHIGIAEGRKPSPNFSSSFIPSIEQQLALLKQSEWFNSGWYLIEYPDVASSGIDAAVHYLQFGYFEGRYPNDGFKDITKPQIDARLLLLHASEWFDEKWYLDNYPDVAELSLDPAIHYLNYGAAEGRLPGPFFDESFYLSQLNERIDQPSGLLHYLLKGEKLGLKPIRSWEQVPWWWKFNLPSAPKVDLHKLKSAPLPVVVIPVFNAVDALANCLASLKQHRQGISKIIIIDDASTDPQVRELLNEYEEDLLFYSYQNELNQGFSGAANKGIQLAGDADIILLNSDTIVTRGFAQHLRLTAYSEEMIATVTPLSNNAGVFSIPYPPSIEVPSQFGLERFALAIAQASLSQPIAVPTGHGFCLYIRRGALDEAGLFDADAFPRGYGEENDFCRRAAALGWQHLIDPRVYIFHQGTASFACEKPELLTSAQAILEQRYPDYPALICDSFDSDSIHRLRQQGSILASLSWRAAQQIKPRLMFVISSLMGGTPLTNQDLMQALQSDYECFVLHCDSRNLALKHFIGGVYTDIAYCKLSTAIEALPHTSDEYDRVVASWLVEWSIDLVHIRHLAWHSTGLLPAAKTLGISIVHSFHDFYTLCPSVKLLDNNLNYCAAKCTQDMGRCEHELWPKDAFINLKHIQIHDWQYLFAQTLKYCDGFVTTNDSAKALFLTRYPELADKPFEVIPHGRNFESLASLATKPKANEKLRILCPGNLGEAKGLKLIQQLALQRPDIEIHILGIITYDLQLPDNIIIHGSYVREKFGTLAAKIMPHCGAVLSIWPETWCHTLTEMWAIGLPVIGIDIGAVGERIRQSQAGWLSHNSSVEGLEEIIDKMRQPLEWDSKVQAVLNWQSNQGKSQNCHAMAMKYASLYKSLIGNS